MDYIYDILLNFNKDYYEFYEWKNNDNIINVRKIPIFKVSSSTYINFKNNEIKLNSDFVQKIKNKTSIYMVNNTTNGMCLFTNGEDVFGAMISNDGKIIKRSSLLLDEASEIIEEIFHNPKEEIEYKIIKNNNIKIVGRTELEKKRELKKFINKSGTNIICLKYLYYEYFNEECGDIVLVKERLNKEISKAWSNKLNELYKLILLFDKIES